MGLYLAEHESCARQEVARKDRLARDAAAHGGGRSLATRLVHAVRQFVDPRGYALSGMRPVAAVTEPAELPSSIPEVATASVSLLDVTEPAPATCDHRVAA
jgi:hypothetical protein